MQTVALLNKCYFHLLYRSTFYPSVSKVHAGSFRVSIIHRTLTWTTGSLMCIRDYCYACVYTRGLGTPHRLWVSTFLTPKTYHKFFLCSRRRRGSNLRSFGSLDLESDALLTELPRHPYDICGWLGVNKPMIYVTLGHFLIRYYTRLRVIGAKTDFTNGSTGLCLL